MIAHALLAIGLPLVAPDGGMLLAAGGTAHATIRLPERPAPAERFAAEELARYLERITGAVFPIREGSVSGPRLEVGGADAELAARGAEAWMIRTEGRRVRLVGGSPRGTLYAVYHLLEDELGVRWWTPWDEWVPQRRTLRLPSQSRAGRPVFAYRDLFGVRASVLFQLRNRLNGHFSGIPAARGGSLRFGPPSHVHTFERRVPAARHFDAHPEWFSEIAGLRVGGRTQWCLTQPGLLDAAARALRGAIAEGEEYARREGLSPPAFYDVSQNDWGRRCECPSCAAAERRGGAASAPLLAFVGELARRSRADGPPVDVTTLAYEYSFAPPRGVAPDPHVVVRVADLYQRDFAAPLAAASNAAVRDALRGWSALGTRLQYWDYRVTFHPDGDLPRADHAWIGPAYRFLADLGVEGVFVQSEFADVADMRDLEVWLTAKLLEDPRRDARALTREFLAGYYGAAARPIARYLRLLEGRVREARVPFGFAPAAGDYVWLDAALVERAQAWFDRAERAVRRDGEALARVRGARVALDRATLARWDEIWPATGERRAPFARERVARRYRDTRLERIERRLRGELAERARAELALEIGGFELDD